MATLLRDAVRVRAFGDRLWDTDINARDSYYDPNTDLSRSARSTSTTTARS